LYKVSFFLVPLAGFPFSIEFHLSILH